jgi:Bacteriophage CI repressor helix-turn-helix domain
MENPKATEVFERLKEALKLPSDVELAQALGLGYQAFSKRKLRNSLPREEVETLIEQNHLCTEWVYAGTGPMYEGGEAQEKRLRDFDDLVTQIHAMSLHNQVTEVVETLIRGVVWGDKAQVQKVVRDLSKLTPEEQQLVSAYRNADESVKAALELIIRGGRPRNAATQTFNGAVGQVVGGDVTAKAINNKVRK